MNKTKLSIVLVIVTIFIFLVTAATCNLCGVSLSEETEASTTGGGEAGVEAVEDNNEVEESANEEVEGGPAEEPAEEPTGEEPAEGPAEEASVKEFIGDLGDKGTVFICDVDEGLSGYVTENGAFVIGTVFLGDTTYDKAVKGYISFDIRELSRDAPVLDARISISGITIDGDPTFADQLIVKVDDFEEINGGDFAVGGDHLAAFSTVGLSTINISSDNLKTLLERKLGDNKDYFQIKLGLDSYTGNPGIADVFIINLDNAELMVTQ